MSQTLKLVEDLFRWNQVNLIHHAHLQKSELSNFFAQQFVVKANGHEYAGNYENYFEFLNQFRSTIQKISYLFGQEVIHDRRVALPIKAEIQRRNGDTEYYDAMLILEFDSNDKIILWHEVYVKL